MKKSTFIYSFLLSFCFALSNYAAVLNPEEPPEDTATVPIGDHSWILALVSILYLFMKLKNKPKTHKV